MKNFQILDSKPKEITSDIPKAQTDFVSEQSNNESHPVSLT
jgi:hypothetical protein